MKLILKEDGNYLEMVNKTFYGDFKKIAQKIKNNEHFSFVRFGDGELMIINREFIDISNKFNGEHKYNPKNVKHDFFRQKMQESLQYNEKEYLVGIPCKCCVGEEKYKQITKLSKQPQSSLTWANLFVNSNYKHFITEILPLFKLKKIVLISHKNAILDKLPFKVQTHIKVGANAWINDYSKVEELKKLAKKSSDTIFLFAAGTFSNLAIKECHELNTNNTFLDIGSTLDVILNLGHTRRYLKNGTTLNKTCIW